MNVIIELKKTNNTLPLVDFSMMIYSGTPPFTFKWNFGDGNTDTVNNVVQHEYTTTGNFTVSLSVTDSVGNNATTSKIITVASNNNVYSNGISVNNIESINRTESMQIGVVYNETDLANRTESLTITN